MISGSAHWLSDELVRRVKAECDSRTTTVIGGFCQDYADYRYACGFFEGMSKALEIADEIKQEQDNA